MNRGALILTIIVVVMTIGSIVNETIAYIGTWIVVVILFAGSCYALYTLFDMLLKELNIHSLDNTEETQ